jgi:hypothetical protein
MSAPIWAADRDRRSSSNASGGTISRFYDEYHGHTVSHLDTLVGMLPNGRSVMYLMGDSTLDNKYWLGRQTLPACNGYERCLAPPRSPADVAFCLNAECVQRGLGDSYCCVNAAVEESTLGLRDGGKLLPQDAFVRRQLCEKDVLIVSMGGNDIVRTQGSDHPQPPRLLQHHVRLRDGRRCARRSAPSSRWCCCSPRRGG